MPWGGLCGTATVERLELDFHVITAGSTTDRGVLCSAAGTARMADDRFDVRETYEHIAEQFSKTRAYPWPETKAFCEGRRAGTALDVGCGNGRNAELLADHADRVVGVDASGGLLDLARERVPGEIGRASCRERV